MAAEPDIFGASVVAVGSFNPPIFSPAWLRLHNLIGADDEQGALSDPNLVVSRGLTRFNTGAFTIQVLEGQLSIGMNTAVSPALRDLAVGVLSILLHTPITAVGLNFYGHFKIKETDRYHRIGDALAPKAVWQNAFKVDKENLGLTEMTVADLGTARHKLEQRPQDSKKVTVGSSNKVVQGIFFQMNDHRVVARQGDATAAQIAATIVEKNWEATWRQSLQIFSDILDGASR